MKRISKRLLIILSASIALGVLSCGDNAKEETSTPALPKGPTEYQTIVKKAYELKKTGQNKKALEQFKKAIVHAPPQSTIYASALDDQASVLLRIGKIDEAQKMYEKAIGVLNKISDTHRLREGVVRRLATLKALRKRGITCKEPGEPLPNSAVPYFPNVPDFQRALGSMTRKVAECEDSNTIKPITIRILVTGTGQFVRAYAKDEFAGTKTETCVVNKLKELLPKTELPKFGACYRGFTYPFMIGNHPEKTSPAVEDSDPTSSKTPTENLLKGSAPAVDSARIGAQKLLDAYKTGTPEPAMDFFFPAAAFDEVKDGANPSRYHKKLLQWYKEDIVLESPRLKGEDWQVSDVTLGNCKWKEPGTESNKIAYWSCTRNMVTVNAGEKQRRFEIRVLINWGKEWYVTHLRAIRN